MKKTVLLLIAAAALTGCMQNSELEKNMSVLADEMVNLQITVGSLQSSVDEANLRNDALAAELSQVTENVTELQTEVSYLGNEVTILKQGNQKPAPAPAVQDDKAPRIVIIEDVAAMRNSLYSYAYELYRKGEHNESIAKFEEFISKLPNDELADNAQYWIGENYYSMMDYPKALAAFQKVMSDYPKEGKVPDAMLKEGYTYRLMGQKTKASESLNKVIKQYPKSNAAKLAQQTLATWK